MINQKEHVHRKGKNPELCLIIQHESKKNCAKQQSCDQNPSSTPILSLGIEAANVTHVYTLAVNHHLVLNRNKLNKNELKRLKQKSLIIWLRGRISVSYSYYSSLPSACKWERTHSRLRDSVLFLSTTFLPFQSVPALIRQQNWSNSFLTDKRKTKTKREKQCDQNS